MRFTKVTYYAFLIFLVVSLCSFIGPKKQKRKARKARRVEMQQYMQALSESVPADTLVITAEDLPSESEPVEEVAEVVEETPEAPEEEEVSGNSPFVDDLLKEAFSHLGTRYTYGASGPSSFDCSGFTRYCFNKMGISLPHSSRDQYKAGKQVEFMDEVKPGDLVFFRGRNAASTINHVGIVTEVGPGGETFSFIHASTSAGVIVSKSTEQYYHVRYVGIRRVCPED